jgi:retron-type reverse transcriptase
MRSKSYSLDQSPFYMLRNGKKLANLLGINTAELRRLSKRADTLYREFEVPKKSGGLRGVENPCRELKLVQARIARLLSRVTPPEYLFCPVKGRCYVDNAAAQQGQRVVHCLDIRKYFPNTPSQRIYWFFNKIMKCESDIAATLAKLATYQGHLPTGSPLSPIMAYFAYYDVWEALAKICRNHRYRLTVYIDDVTISAMKMTPGVIWKIKTVIHGAGLRYHKEKRFVDTPAEITGVIVDQHGLTTPNRQHKKLYFAKKSLLAAKGEVNTEHGRLQVNGLKAQIAQIASKGGMPERVMTTFA